LVKLEPKSAPAWGDGYTYGFRVPLMVVSAYTPAHYVDNGIHDFGSILYFIEKNFNLGTIGPGDTIYSHYADWQEETRGDDLHQFFSLTSAKPFVYINTNVPDNYFQSRPPSSVPVDTE
jgi:phospholipase C